VSAASSPPLALSGTWALFVVSARTLLRAGRTVALLGIALLPLAVAVAQAIRDEEPPDRVYAELLASLVVPTVMAFVALVLASSSFGEDREDGTILYVVATRIPRWAIVVAKAGAAWVVSMAIIAPTLAATALVLDQAAAGALVWPLLAAALLAAAYAGLFAWVSLLTRRAIVVGVVYILLWEGTIATFAASADRLSIGAYARVLAGVGGVDVERPEVSAPTATVVLLVLALAGVLLARRALRRVELP